MVPWRRTFCSSCHAGDRRLVNLYYIRRTVQVAEEKQEEAEVAAAILAETMTNAVGVTDPVVKAAKRRVKKARKAEAKAKKVARRQEAVFNAALAACRGQVEDVGASSGAKRKRKGASASNRRIKAQKGLGRLR